MSTEPHSALTIPDSLLGKVHSEQDKILLGEAIACLKAGALRSAYIVTWLTIAESLKNKLKEMSYRDGSIRKIISEVERREGDGKAVDKYVLEQAAVVGLVDASYAVRLGQIYTRPCLNRAATHHREARVTDCHLSFGGPGHRPVGTFSCDCGFSYARTGPDALPGDRFRISRMKSFGPVWEQALKRLWADPALGVSGVARQLGVDPLTVRRHATRLGLPFQRAGRNAIRPLASDDMLKAEDGGRTLGRKRQENRRRWLSAMDANPKISMRSLRRGMPREYVWLLQNDVDWLKAHRPARPKHKRSSQSVDWARRDAKLATAIRSKAVELLNAPGRPVFLSKTAICNSLGITSLIRQKIQKLPLTADALAGVSESRVEYAVRRVRWATRSYLQEGVFPQRWRLVFRANVARWAGCQQVTEELDSAMEMFETADSRMPRTSTG